MTEENNPETKIFKVLLEVGACRANPSHNNIERISDLLGPEDSPTRLALCLYDTGMMSPNQAAQTVAMSQNANT